MELQRISKQDTIIVLDFLEEGNYTYKMKISSTNMFENTKGQLTVLEEYIILRRDNYKGI